MSKDDKLDRIIELLEELSRRVNKLTTVVNTRTAKFNQLVRALDKMFKRLEEDEH